MNLSDLHNAELVFRPRKRKLTIEQIAEAIELRGKGIGYERLGMIFNVGSDCIRYNIKGAQEHGYNWWKGGENGISR
jgi:hypothetical protein